MIFTDGFVYVHEPKTGGSFVTAALMRLHGVRWSRRMRLESMLRGQVTRRGPHGAFTYHNLKHGTVSQVPPAHRGKTVLATVRGPYEMYVSQYEFGWWRRREMRPHFAAVPDFARRFPRFPDLGFAEFVELWDAAMGQVDGGGGEGRGAWTCQFIRFYVREPGRAWPDAVLRDPEARRAAMPCIRFVRTAEVREGLHAFLLEQGYPAGDVAFVREMGKVLPGRGRRDDQSWERYYTPELKDRVRRRERLLLDIFPDLDV